GTEGIDKSAMSERDSALKEKLDRFLEKAKQELGQLTELFPDREGGDNDPDINDKLDESTMNQLLKNLIAKLLNKDFPGYAEGDELARKELAKKRAPAQEPKARRAENSLKNLKSELDALMGEPARALKDSDKRELRDLTHRQDTLKDRTQALREKLESLFQLFPSLDPKSFRTSAKPENPWAMPRSGSASSILEAPCRPSATPLNSCRNRNNRCNPPCSRWPNAASWAICRSPGFSAGDGSCRTEV